MKKAVLTSLVVLLFSCNSNSKYSTMVESTYNLNRMAASLILKSDTTRSAYSAVEKKASTFIYDNKSDFIFKVSDDPSKIEIIDSSGNLIKWSEERGYKITIRNSGDTLVVRFFPTANTPKFIYKFGMEYKFYK